MKPFKKAICGRDRISVIAEIKRRSPSYGHFPRHPVKNLVAAYERGGASAISVVTDSYLFNGSLDLLREARSATKLPIIRKDFITETHQIDESKEAGANAVLLIVRMLDKRRLHKLSAYACEKGIDVVLEIHDEGDFKKIAGIEHAIIGINNRNLKTFRTNVRYAAILLNRLDPNSTIIAESAFTDPKEFVPYQGKIDAVLIGTALLTSPSPYKKLLSFTT